jgi:hypothetical protein
MVVNMKMNVFWDAAPCSPIEIDRRFGDAFCVHHTGSQKEAIFVIVAVRTSDLTTLV